MMPRLDDHNFSGHIGVERAGIFVCPGLGEGTVKALPRRERHCATHSIVEHERMR